MGQTLKRTNRKRLFARQLRFLAMTDICFTASLTLYCVANFTTGTASFLCWFADPLYVCLRFLSVLLETSIALGLLWTWRRYCKAVKILNSYLWTALPVAMLCAFLDCLLSPLQVTRGRLGGQCQRLGHQ